MRTRTSLFGLGLIACVSCSLLFSNVGTAQDFEPDAICRLKSDLSIVPGILSAAGWARNFDNSVTAGADLNTNHTLISTSCDGDKFKVISTYNVCYIEQTSSTRWFVVQCNCNDFSNLEIKVKFSQNFNINGGIIDPRKKTFNITIDPAEQPGGFCS
jgi:hypothetical protein